jgi:hypothetical protein
MAGKLKRQLPEKIGRYVPDRTSARKQEKDGFVILIKISASYPLRIRK